MKLRRKCERLPYGFNGKENDNEIKGEGNQIDYGMRVYDSRLGRFLSIDPLTRNYPWYTPYQYAGNNPVTMIDLDGLEPIRADISQIKRYGNNAIKVKGAATIQIQIINMSSTPSNKLNVFDLRNGIQQGLNNLLSGSNTSKQNTPFTTKDGKVINLPNNQIQEHDITYDINLNVKVSVINSINQLSKNAIPIAIVDKLGKEEAGVANKVTSVAAMEAGFLSDPKLFQKGVTIALHEIAHTLGADDIYDSKNLERVKTSNLMNSVPYMTKDLTTEQINNMWRSTIGPWQELWKTIQDKNKKGKIETTNENVEKDLLDHINKSR